MADTAKAEANVWHAKVRSYALEKIILNHRNQCAIAQRNGGVRLPNQTCKGNG